MTERLILDDVPATAWAAFHAGRTVGLAPELVRCWSRARGLGAPAEGPRPEDVLLRGDALRAHVGPVELLRAVGDSILDRATARAAERDFLLLVADADGVVVRASGGGQFAPVAERLLLIEGACWSEDARGTNAIGTAVVDNRPTEVHGHAHFGRSYHDLVCYAAPVRGVDGRPIAVLDATSRLDRADPELGRIVVDAAHALEQLVRLHAYASAGSSVARVLGRSLDRMREPAMLIEAPCTIARTNPSAR